VSSENLDKSLRDEINRHIDARLRGVQEEIARIQRQVNDSFMRLSERLAGEADQPSADVAVAISEHIHAARASGIEQAATQSARARASSDVAMLKAAVDDIDNQRAQTDILGALVNRSAAFAPRVIFFIIKNNRATAWRARGLEGTIGDAAVSEISVPLEAQTFLSEVVNSRSTWSGTSDSHPENNSILSRLGDEQPPERIVAVPLVARGRAVAVLYADCATLDSEAINLEALETLVRVAGMAVELLAVSRPQPTTPAPPPAQAFTRDVQPVASATTSSPPPQQQSPASSPSNMEMSAAETGALVAEQPATPPTFTAEQSAPPASSTDAQETPTVVSSPPPAVVETAAPLGTARRYGRGANAELPVEVADDDERRLHNDARRFARILVDEIKLYKEQQVREGRAGSDLYRRLREDMERSREAYDKRVNPRVAARYDYFHHELVNTLAEGDASKLGEDYPGARV
jgi:hypothetical protein